MKNNMLLTAIYPGGTMTQTRICAITNGTNVSEGTNTNDVISLYVANDDGDSEFHDHLPVDVMFHISVITE